MRFSLTQEQRTAFLHGGCPRIEQPATKDNPKPVCPVSAGHIHRISQNMWLEVLEVRPKKGGGWSLRYKVIDKRDPKRILRHVPPPQPVNQKRNQTDREAAIESAYGGSGENAVAECGEGVDEASLKAFAQEAGQMNVLHHEARRAKWERLTLAERAQELESLAPLSAADVSREMRLAAHAMEKAREKLERHDKAA